jgi:hypothetical protein
VACCLLTMFFCWLTLHAGEEEVRR